MNKRRPARPAPVMTEEQLKAKDLWKLRALLMQLMAQAMGRAR